MIRLSLDKPVPDKEIAARGCVWHQYSLCFPGDSRCVIKLWYSRDLLLVCISNIFGLYNVQSLEIEGTQMTTFGITATNLQCAILGKHQELHILSHTQMRGRQNLTLYSDSSSKASILKITLLGTDWGPGFSPNTGISCFSKQCSSIKAFLIVCIRLAPPTWVPAISSRSLGSSDLYIRRRSEKLV